MADGLLAAPHVCQAPGFDEAKLENPQLAHLPIARTLSLPPLELSSEQLRRRHRGHRLITGVEYTLELEV